MKNIIIYKKIINGMGALLLSFAFFNTHSANVMVATTSEMDMSPLDAIYDMFAAISGNVMTDKRATLGQGNSMTDFANHDVVVVVSTAYTLDADEQAALINAINNKASGAFVLLFDGCCGNGNYNDPGNAQATVDILNAVITPPPSPSVSAGSFITGAVNYGLVSGPSYPYSHSFAALPVIAHGAAYRRALDLPAVNTVYEDPSKGPVGVFLPEADTDGACVFSLMDVTPFKTTNISANSAFAQVIQDAILDPVGSCHRSAVGNAVVAEDDSYTLKPSLIIEKDTANNTIVVLDNDSELQSEGLQLEASGTDTYSANGGTITISGSTLIYTPLTGFEGTDTFTYEVCVPSGACDTALVTVLVVNPPYAVYDNVTTPVNTPVTIAVLDNDIISTVTPASVSSFTQAASGIVTQLGDSFTYTPDNNFVGQDTFTYTICDTANACSTATVTIRIGLNSAVNTKNIPSVSWYGLLLMMVSIFGWTLFRRKF